MDRRALERILAEIDHCGHVRRDLGTRPAPRLLDRTELEVIDADGAEMRPTEVEDFVPRSMAPCQ